MRRLSSACIAVTLAGCFDPSPPLGLPCGTGGVCPDGQRCDPLANECIAITADDAIAIQFEAAESSLGEGETMEIAVTLSRPADTEITAVVTLSGTASGFDFALSRSEVTFAPGESMQILELDAIDEAAPESAEFLTLALTDPVGAELGVTDSHVVTITDAGGLILAFESMDSTYGESTGTETITVVLSRPGPGDVTFSVEEAGGSAGSSDYSLPTNSFTIPQGSTSIGVPVSIINDSLDEGTETLDVELIGISGLATVSTVDHEVMITDDDPTPSVQFDPTEPDASASEGATGTLQYSYRVVLSAVSGRTVTVPVGLSGTASGGNDYTISTGDIPVTFTAGTSTRTIRVNVTGDVVIELGETVVLTLQNPTNASLGATTVRTHTISNDD